MSLQASLDPTLHCHLGEALRPLCDEGVLVVASAAGGDAPVRRLWAGTVGPTHLGGWAFD
jgi:hypothetical protein